MGEVLCYTIGYSGVRRTGKGGVRPVGQKEEQENDLGERRDPAKR